MSYTDFPLEQELKGEVIEIDTAIFRYPYRIRIEDDRVAIFDLHGFDHYGHLFEYPSFEYLSCFGKRGDSPEDVLSMENIQFYNHSLWMLDSNKHELTRLNFSSSRDSLLRGEVVNLGEDILRALYFAVCNDTTFIIPDYSGENRFCWINRNGKCIRKVGKIPSSNKDALENAKPALAQAWRSFIDYNPHNGILVSVTQLGEVLEIYNVNDTTSRKICIGPNGEPKFKVAEGYGIPTGIMGFCDVQITDNAIYAVFQGTSFKDIIRNQGSLPNGGKYIYVFDLEGKPIRKYVLDHYVSGIWVDEANKTIHGLDVNKDQPVVKYMI